MKKQDSGTKLPEERDPCVSLKAIVQKILTYAGANFTSQSAPSKEDVRDFQAQVKGVSSDSRQVGKGWIFVAVDGVTQDGHQFVSSALAQGCTFFVVEKPVGDLGPGVTVVEVSQSRAALAELAAAFHGYPADSLVLLGVTGTSGKTTISYLLESILSHAGHEVGVIGTVNFRYGTKIFESSHTTPGPAELQALLAQMKQEGCTAVVMEVSSHALKQDRVGGIAFDGVAFSNLSPEHLDFHPDMEDYFAAKSRLFLDRMSYSHLRGKKPFGVIHTEDAYGKRLAEMASQFSQKLPQASYRASSFSLADYHDTLKLSLSGIEGQYRGVTVRSSLVGSFNATNLACAVSCALELGLDAQTISQGVSQLKQIPGRLEKVPQLGPLHVWVDYAHKPDALKKVIHALRSLRNQSTGKAPSDTSQNSEPAPRLITVFGCGGDRDRQKRPVMGKIAAEGSDWVFITSDNPRTEDPEKILKEILAGVGGYQNFTVDADRRSAIEKAIRFARGQDLILIAGKGHEDYQILGTRKIHFDDREVVQEIIQNINKERGTDAKP